MPVDEGSLYVANKVLDGLAYGIAPQNMKDFSLTGGSGQITIKCTPPDDTVIENQCVCTVRGVKVIRKIGSSPKNVRDGDLIADVKVGNTLNYIDKNLSSDRKYYYGFFPYSDNGVYNTNHANVLSAKADNTKYFAFDQDFSNLDPATTISYPLGFTNTNYTPMMTNEGNGTVTAGSWLGFLQDTLMNYPFMVFADGTTDYQLDPDDYTKKIDGTVSDYDNTSYSGAGAFAWLNKIYIHEEYSSTGESREVQFSTTAEDGFYPIGFVDFNSEELEGVWLPMGYISATGKTLISGEPSKSLNTSQQYNLIKSVGSRAVFLGGPILNLLRDLEYMLFKSTDIQKCAGYGCSSKGSVSDNSIVKNGTVPGWYGTSINAKVLNKYFHSQVLGGYNQWIRDPYVITKSGSLRMSEMYTYDLSGASYHDTGIIFSSDSGDIFNKWIYPNHLYHISNTIGSFPVAENTASGATGLCDGSCISIGDRVSLRLGNCDHGADAGPAFVYLYRTASITNVNYGAGVLLLPSAGYTPEVV
jgi:hypothetical protein